MHVEFYQIAITFQIPQHETTIKEAFGKRYYNRDHKKIAFRLQATNYEKRTEVFVHYPMNLTNIQSISD
jgi:hypothetical protein